MLPEELLQTLRRKISESEHPREVLMDVMYAVQSHHGYLSDEALHEVGGLMDMTPLEVEEVATFCRENAQ